MLFTAAPISPSLAAGPGTLLACILQTVSVSTPRAGAWRLAGPLLPGAQRAFAGPLEPGCVGLQGPCRQCALEYAARCGPAAQRPSALISAEPAAGLRAQAGSALTSAQPAAGLRAQAGSALPSAEPGSGRAGARRCAAQRARRRAGRSRRGARLPWALRSLRADVYLSALNTACANDRVYLCARSAGMGA